MIILYWMLCILIGIIPAYIIYRKDRQKQIPLRWLPASLRFLLFFCTAALLLAPAFTFRKNEVEKPMIIWLQDASASFATALKNDTQQYRQKAERLLKDWGKDYSVKIVPFSGTAGDDQVFTYDGHSTNIAAALQSVSEQFQDRNIGAIILSSDGIYNEGLDPLYLPWSNNIPVYTIATGDSTQPKDIRIDRIFANKTVAAGSKFEVSVNLRAEKLSGLQTALSLSQNSVQLKQQAIRIDKDRYAGSVHFEVEAKGKGLQRFRLAIPEADGEPNVWNNAMDFYVHVIDEEIKILILAGAPHPDIAAIRAALESVPQYKVEIGKEKAFPKNLQQYHVIIAHQIPQNIPTEDVGFPVWYILGSQSNVSLLSRIQQVIQVNSSSGAGNVLPRLNPGFGYFTFPAQIREVLAKLPPLTAPLGKYTLLGDAQAILWQTDGSSPLWAVRNGAIPQAILVGEGLWRWRMYEYKNFNQHQVVDELIRQTVSLLSAHKDRAPFRVYLDKYVLSDNEQIFINAELRNANGELVNTPEANLILKDSTDNVLSYNFEKTATGYRINLGLLAPGTYSFLGETTFNGKPYRSEGTFVVERIPLESLRSYSDYATLYQLSQKTGGAFFTQENFLPALQDSIRLNPQIRPVIHVHESHEPLIHWKWLFFLILFFASSEWLLRKYWNS